MNGESTLESRLELSLKTSEDVGKLMVSSRSKARVIAKIRRGCANVNGLGDVNAATVWQAGADRAPVSAPALHECALSLPCS